MVEMRMNCRPVPPSVKHLVVGSNVEGEGYREFEVGLGLE
jgi:hypothetical protein